jgi:uncharacterized protein (DUF488 family)
MTLFTIGYAKHTPASLFDRLELAGVAVLLDVRELPLSRKRGFSKTALANSAAEHGLEYRHVKALGVPSELRRRLRSASVDAGDYINLFRAILRESSNVLAETVKLVESAPTCLLCLEERPEDCHRTVVAQELMRASESKLTIENL